jgi:hypothetical protein
LKYVYPKETMASFRGWFEREVPGRLPARLLYQT